MSSEESKPQPFYRYNVFEILELQKWNTNQKHIINYEPKIVFEKGEEDVQNRVWEGKVSKEDLIELEYVDENKD